MSDNRYYVKSNILLIGSIDGIWLDVLGEQLQACSCRSVLTQQGSKTLVQSSQLPFLMHRQTQQVGIRDLLVSNKSIFEALHGFVERNVVGPEPVSWMLHVKTEEPHGLRH
jgi:hypothetical protein